MSGGYVKLWRKLLDNQSWSRGMAHRAMWVTLLLKANWKRQYFNGYPVEAGQLPIGLESIARDLKIPKTTAHRVLRDLEHDGLILSKNMGNRYTLITIINWVNYQSKEDGDETASVRRRYTIGPQVDPLEEGKNTYPSPNGEGVGADSPSAPPQEEGQRRATRLPVCPQERIVDLYHSLLPELPRVKTWTGQRAKHLQARWKERMAQGKFLDREGGLAYFRRLFEYVRGSPFLMGQVAGHNGRTFRASLAWLALPENFAKLIEGKYHDRGTP